MRHIYYIISPISSPECSWILVKISHITMDYVISRASDRIILGLGPQLCITWTWMRPTDVWMVSVDQDHAFWGQHLLQLRTMGEPASTRTSQEWLLGLYLSCLELLQKIWSLFRTQAGDSRRGDAGGRFLWRRECSGEALPHSARLVALVQLSSASVERIFSQVKLICESAGVSPLEETVICRVFERCNDYEIE